MVDRLVKRVVDATIVPLVEYTLMRVRQDTPVWDHAGSRHSVPDEVQRRAVADSADYAESHMREAMCIRGAKEELWRHAFAQRTPYFSRGARP